MKEERRIALVGAILASNFVAKDRRQVGWMYREKPEHNVDSGWRVYSGDEDQTYADTAENFAWYNASTIVAIDPSIAPYLDCAIGSAFERDPKTGDFVEVDEFDPEDE